MLRDSRFRGNDEGVQIPDLGLVAQATSGVCLPRELHLHLDLAKAEDIAVPEFRFVLLNAVDEATPGFFHGLDVVPSLVIHDSGMKPGNP